MTRIKICGLTRLADVAAVNACQPDYIGLVFAPSRRQVTAELAARLVQALNPGITPVGVFVNEKPEVIRDIVQAAGLKVVQLHGQEDAAYRLALASVLPAGTAIWQKLSIPADPEAAAKLARKLAEQTKQASDADQASTADQARPDAWLLDTEIGGQTGGTGKPFPWHLLAEFCQKNPVILAGGLNPDNVATAIQLLRPLGVDCSSGVELNGVKHPPLIEAFCRQVRLQDERLTHERT
jgi:phosphoribosylanthranilate isomerase